MTSELDAVIGRVEAFATAKKIPSIWLGPLQHDALALLSENKRLNAALRYEQDRTDRIGTHGPGCASWGPRHYECALAELAALRGEGEKT